MWLLGCVVGPATCRCSVFCWPILRQRHLQPVPRGHLLPPLDRLCIQLHCMPPQFRLHAWRHHLPGPILPGLPPWLLLRWGALHPGMPTPLLSMVSALVHAPCVSFQCMHHVCLHCFVSMVSALVHAHRIYIGSCLWCLQWYLHWFISMVSTLVSVYATCIGSCLWYLHWFVATLPALVRLHWFVCIGSGLHQCMHPVCLPHWCVDLGKGPDRAVLLERTAPRPASTPAPSASFARPAPTHLAPTQPSVSCAPQAPTPPLRPTPSAQHARQAPTSQAQGSLCARSVSQATTSQLRASPPAPSARKAPGRASQAPACASSVQQEFLPRRQGWETCRGAFRALRAPTRRCWGEMRHVPLAQRDGISPEQAVPRVCLARWGPMLRAPVPLPAQAAPP